MQPNEDDVGGMVGTVGAGGLILGVRERNGALEFQVFGMTTKAQTDPKAQNPPCGLVKTDCWAPV